MSTTLPPTLSPLSFPPATFAALTPGPYLLSHLQSSTRPSGRRPSETRKPTIHPSSLTHSSGSAVVRLGSTAVATGIRAEILLARDIPDPSLSPTLLSLGLLVPNVELSTGCSPGNLPGQAPSGAAQGLTHRLHAGLLGAGVLGVGDLEIREQVEDEEGAREVVRGYWALYLDVLVLSDDGAVFDAVWAAAMAALRDVRIPEAEWDQDREMVVCSPLMERARRLRVQGKPVAVSFAVYSSESKIRGEEGQAWVLADPDGMEEGVCREGVTVMVGEGGEVLRVEKHGGAVVGVEQMKEIFTAAKSRWSDWNDAMGVDGMA